MATFDEDSDQTGYNEYDKKFTEDISKKMQIPDKLVPVNDNESTSFNLRDNQANATQPSSQFEEPMYLLSTPPTTMRNFYGTRSNEEMNDDSDLMMTPGTMLMRDDGDKVCVLKRQVAKLSRRLVDLEEETHRRNTMNNIMTCSFFFSIIIYVFRRFFFST